jgi:two-component system, chemotaxis family, sensor kinase CheA
MDDLLREFLTETAEHLDIVDVELVRFERDPNNEKILSNIFRLVHTIKGTCGFLGLPRLEALAHAAETLMGKFRDGMAVTSEAVTLILATLDRVKEILAELEKNGIEPDGIDEDLISELDRMSNGEMLAAPQAQAQAQASVEPEPEPVSALSAEGPGAMPFQIVERALKPGEVSLDDLERAFQEAEGPDFGTPVTPEPASALPVSAKAVSETPPVHEPVKAEVPKAEVTKAEAKVPAKSPEKTETPAAGGGEEGGSKIQTIRVNVDTLEHLMTMVSELVLTRNQLLEIARRQEDSAYKVPLQRLSHVTAELQEGVMKTRMQPIGSAWQKLPRIVRDLSGELNKKIELIMQGAETELDRQVLEVIKDPLTHMVRNSADHGIEDTAGRKAVGKPEKGTIRLNAYHEGGNVTIEIADDGKGLNHSAIRRKAVERGLASEAEVERMNDAQVAKFIFHPGFSTAAAITSVSGRGVGMDVVKTNIQLIGGTIDIRSEEGRGTTFTIKIPLTLAIVSALIVSAKDSEKEQRYAIPQIAVLELVRVKTGSDHVIERINGTPILRLRDRLLPIVPLNKVLDVGGREADAIDEGFVVVTQVGRQRFGILVDGVFHTEEIVVKPMSSKLRHIQLYSGNTILGDGAVVLIVDPNGLARMVGSGAGNNPMAMEDGSEEETNASNETVTLLVFRAGGETVKAVPLSLVTRLEEIDATKIEWVGGRPLFQYRGRLMPLVPADSGMSIRQEGPQSLVVFSDGERTMGLVVDEIVDIIDDVLNIELATDRSDLVGSAVLRNRATEIVNVAHYLPLAHEDWTSAAGQGQTQQAMRTVLLVDDSSFFRDMLSPVLKAAGYKVITAGGVDEALNTLSIGKDIHSIVTDVEMPGKDGFMLAEQVRANRAFAHMPIIALGSVLAPDALARARKLGITDFVAKFDRSGLIAALKENQTSMGEAA